MMRRYRSMLGIVITLLAVGACDEYVSAPRNSHERTSMIMANDTSADSLSSGPCSRYDGNHCAFITFSSQQLDWMQQAIDETLCSDMRSGLNRMMLHGWIHKVDLMSVRPPGMTNIWYADDHYVQGSHLGDGFNRIHLDKENAFTSAESVAHEMRHEAAHIMHPEIIDEAEVDAFADSCSP